MGDARSPSSSVRAVKTLFGLGEESEVSAADDFLQSMMPPPSARTSSSSSSAGSAQRARQQRSVTPRARPAVSPATPATSRKSSSRSSYDGPRDSEGLRPWVPSSAHEVDSTRKPRGGHFSFSVEGLQKDHAALVDEVIEELTRGSGPLSISSTMAIEPKKFAPIYDKLERELASVLHAPTQKKSSEADEVSRARDVQHIVSIVFSLVEHERAALSSSIAMTRERARKSQQKLQLQLEQQEVHFKRQGVRSGARLLRALARTLVDERPMRRLFGRWSRQCAAFRAREYEVLAKSSAQASRQDREFSSLKSDQLEDLLVKVSELERRLTSARRTDDGRRSRMAALTRRASLNKRARRAWTKWVNVARLETRRLSAVRRMCGHSARSEIERYWVKWRWRTQQATVMRRLVRGRWSQRMRATGFHAWLHKTTTLHRRLSLIGRVLKSIGCSLIKPAWAVWKREVAIKQAAFERRRTLGVALFRFRKQRRLAFLKSTLKTMLLYVKDRCRARCLMARSASRTRRLAMTRWTEETRRSRVNGVTLQRHLTARSSVHHHQRRLCFKAWQSHHLRSRRLLRRSRDRHLKGLLGSYFVGWTRAVRLFLKSDLEIALRGLSATRRRLTHSETNLASEVSKKLKASHSAARSMFAAWAGKCLAQVWFAWLAGFRQRRSRHVATARKALQFWILASARKALAAWICFVSSRRKARTIVGHHGWRRARRSLAHYWRRWERGVVERTLEEHENRRFAHKMLSSIFYSWRHVVQVLKGHLPRLVASSLRRRVVSAGLARAWQSWTLHVLAGRQNDLDRSRRLTVFRRLRVRLSARVAARCFRSWASFARYQRRARSILRRYLGQFAKSELREQARAFRAWLDHGHVIRRHELSEDHSVEAARLVSINDDHKLRILDAVRRRMTHCLLNRSMRGWASKVAERVRARRVAGAVLRRIAKLKIYAALSTWKAAVGEMNHARKLCGLALKRISRVKLWAALRTWKDVLRQQDDARRLELLVVKRIAQVKLWAALRTWKDVLKQQDHAHKLANLVVKRISKFKAWVAWRTWKAHLRAMDHARGLGVVVLRRMVKFRLWSSFSSWKTQLQSQKQKHFTLERCARRMRQSRLSRAMNCWRDLNAHRGVARRLMVGVLRRWHNGRLACALATWRSANDTARTHHRVLSLFLARVTHLTHLKAFNSWRDFLAKRRVARSTVRRFSRRSHLGQLKGAMRTWAAYSRSAQREQENGDERLRKAAWLWRQLCTRSKTATLREAVKRWRRVALFLLNATARVVTRWAVVATNLASRGLQEAATLLDIQRRVGAQQQLEDRILRRRLHCALTAEMWLAWRDYLHRRSRLREIICLSVVKRGLTVAFSTWVVGLREQKRLQLASLKIEQRRSQSTARSVFRCWQSGALVRARLRRVVAHRSTRRSRWAWLTWRSQVARLVKQGRRDRQVEVTLTRARRRHDKRLILLVFKEWCGAVSSNRRRFSTLVIRRIILCQQQRLKTQKLQLREGFWRLWALEASRMGRKQTQMILDKIIRRRFFTMHSSVAKAYAGWLDFVQGRVRARQLTKRAVSKFCSLQLARALGKWRECIVRLRCADSDQVLRSEALMRTTRARLINALCLRAIHSWQEVVSTRKLLRNFLKKWNQFYHSRWVLAAFDSWTRAVRAEKRYLFVVGKFRLRMRNTMIYRALNAWVFHRDERKRVRGIARRVLGKARSVRTSAAFMAWRNSTHDARRHAAENAAQRLMLLSEGKLASRLRRTGFRAFALTRSRCQRSRCQAQRWQQQRERRTCAGVFASWRNWRDLALLAAERKRTLLVERETRWRCALRHTLRVLDREATRVVRRAFDRLLHLVHIFHVTQRNALETQRAKVVRRARAVRAIEALNARLRRKIWTAWREVHLHATKCTKLKDSLSIAIQRQFSLRALHAWQDFLKLKAKNRAWLFRAVTHKKRLLLSIAFRAWLTAPFALGPEEAGSPTLPPKPPPPIGGGSSSSSSPTTSPGGGTPGGGPALRRQTNFTSSSSFTPTTSKMGAKQQDQRATSSPDRRRSSIPAPSSCYNNNTPVLPHPISTTSSSSQPNMVSLNRGGGGGVPASSPGKFFRHPSSPADYISSTPRGYQHPGGPRSTASLRPPAPMKSPSASSVGAFASWTPRNNYAAGGLASDYYYYIDGRRLPHDDLETFESSSESRASHNGSH